MYTILSSRKSDDLGAKRVWKSHVILNGREGEKEGKKGKKKEERKERKKEGKEEQEETKERQWKERKKGGKECLVFVLVFACCPFAAPP